MSSYGVTQSLLTPFKLKIKGEIILLKPIVANSPFLDPLKTSINLSFSNDLMGYRKGIDLRCINKINDSIDC